MKNELLAWRISSLRVLPGAISGEVASLGEKVPMTLRKDLAGVASHGFWGRINDPELVARLTDRKTAVITLSHQPLVGVYEPVHSKYLAPGLEQDKGNANAWVLVNFITDVDAVGTERGAFTLEIPGIGKDGGVVLKSHSPYGQIMPDKKDIYAAIVPPNVEQTAKFLERVAADLAGVLPDQAEQINQRNMVLQTAFLEKGQFCENLAQWSTFLRHVIYQKCGIKVVEIGERDFLKSRSAVVGLAGILANYDQWFVAHREIYEKLSDSFSQNDMFNFFPGPRKERELPFWILTGSTRSRAVLVKDRGQISVVAGGKNFILGSSEVLDDKEELIRAIKESGLNDAWAWDVLSFTYLMRFCWGLPYIAGRGGAKYDVVTEYIARSLDGSGLLGELILDKDKLIEFGYSPLWVGIPDERNPRHRSLPRVYSLVQKNLTEIQEQIYKTDKETRETYNPRRIKGLGIKIKHLDEIRKQVDRVRTSQPSLLEMYLLGGPESVLAVLTAVSKWESRLVSKRMPVLE